ncbi:hypothetical protein CTAYLR_006062 [Chrysophaeum taylorii]|uniref:cGMP-dependent protein kinase n=1 Tax=Chrysophaeum taylorii TaxID=2483200 RepID=A0AAD7XLF0_9STRA|nr:hypothetical protein CTAYLR_006062 [Chrysophaeum taylorii]
MQRVIARSISKRCTSKLSITVESANLEEARRIMNEQEKELVRLRHLARLKELELDVLKHQCGRALQQHPKSRRAALREEEEEEEVEEERPVESSNEAGEAKKRKVILGPRDTAQNLEEVPIVPKSDELRELIWNVCLDNVLFADLESPVKQALTDPFAPIEVSAGNNVVTQGHAGDLFYIVESGRLRVFVKNDDEDDGADAATSTSPSDIRLFRTHATLGKFLHVLGPGSSFGELALMYDTPRAATIHAVTDCKLWAIRRDECKAVLQTIQRDEMERRVDFLREVCVGDTAKKISLGELLTDIELNRLAGALETESVVASEIIIRQGQVGNHFYLIESGEVSVHKNLPSSCRRMSVVLAENRVTNIAAGGYFGELALINEDVRAASVKAVTDCRLLTLSRADFIQHLGSLSELLAEAHDLEATGEDRRTSKLAEKKYDGQEEDEEHENNDPYAGIVAKARKTTTTTTIDEDRGVGIHDFDVLGTLGRGSFGTVRLVRHSRSGNHYACKCQPKYKIIQESMQDYVVTECNILAMCRSAFILRLYAAMQTDKFVYLVLELLPGGELYSHLQKLVCFAEPMLRFYASQVILAFECLHEHGVVYRDLKPENLVLDERGYLKVVDFGLSKILTGWNTWTMCGTPEYLAPEILRNEGHNHSVDFWMLGVLIFELGNGNGPFAAQDEMALFEQILRMRPKYPRRFSKHLKDLISRLLTHQKKRLGNSKEGWAAVRKHFWFSGFDWDGLQHKQTVPPLKPVLSRPEDYREDVEFKLRAAENRAIPECPDWTADLPTISRTWRTSKPAAAASSSSSS